MRVIIDNRGVRLIPQDYLERKYIEENPKIILQATPTTYLNNPSFIYEEKKNDKE